MSHDAAKTDLPQVDFPPLNRVAILGLGLMGASLGLALKRRRYGGEVRGYARREETRRLARQGGMLDAVFASPEEAVAGAELVIVCVPILTTIELVSACAANLADGALITDVGSTKAILAARVPVLLKNRRMAFIGSHPVAGSERRGAEAADAAIYDGALVVVTPREGDQPDQVNLLIEFWRALGATVRVMAPADHDRILARTSHLPHMVAALLAATAARPDQADTGAFCSTGFRDTTRIAEGSPDVWRDIAESNRDALLSELEAFTERLAAMKQWLHAGDFEAVRRFLDESRAGRRQIMARAPCGGEVEEQ